MLSQVIILLIVLAGFITAFDGNLQRFKRQNQNCGIPSIFGRGLVYKGESFQRGSWPWMVALMHRSSAKPSKFFCGGTLVSDKKVLTGETSELT